MTRGVDALTEEVRAEVYQELALYNTFTSDNDPYDEHDFGKIVVTGIVLYWKIDYYDKDLTHLSPDPSDPNVTKRVLTLMLASEY